MIKTTKNNLQRNAGGFLLMVTEFGYSGITAKAPCRIRTRDVRIISPTLYPLGYGVIYIAVNKILLIKRNFILMRCQPFYDGVLFHLINVGFIEDQLHVNLQFPKDTKWNAGSKSQNISHTGLLVN